MSKSLSHSRLMSVVALAGCMTTLAIFALPAKASISYQNGSFDVTGTATGAYYGTSAVSIGPAGGWSLAGLAGSAQIACVVSGAATGQVCQGNAPSTLDGPGSPHPSQYYFSLYAYPGASPDGGNYFLEDGDTNFNASLSQTVTGLIVNDYYAVSFWQAAGEENCLADDGPPGCPPPSGKITGQWDVTFGSTTLDSATMTTPVNTSNPSSILTGWQRQTLTFQATAASQVLSFLAFGTPNGAPPLVFLDGISLTQVPEPATEALIGLGLLAVPLGLRLRRGRRRS